MKLRPQLLVLLSFLTLLFSCENGRNMSDHKQFEVAAAATESADIGNANHSDGSTLNVPANRKIIWTGDIELQVKEVEEATANINAICQKYNAFVSKMNLTNNSHRISNELTIRVKNEHFNALINEVKGNAIYTRKVDISSNDVTEEFVDIESRLKTKKEVRERYIKILKNKTGKITDVIAAEEAIRKITEEIEAKEGRLRLLKDQIAFSTVHLELFQKVAYKSAPSVFKKTFLDKAGEALQNGWNIITGLTLGLLNIWPILIIIALLFWKRKQLRQLFRRNN